MSSKVFWIIGGIILVPVALVVLLAAVSAISNTRLPTESEVVERLNDHEKARIAEFFRLHDALGNDVWPGWGDLHIPVIVHNEAYAFLVGFRGEPAAGWTMMPSGEQRGGAWEPVPGDDFLGEPYYRQPLIGAGKTPENFTVKVGDVWVATLQTKEYSAISFYNGFREQLPGFIADIFPYRLMWGLLIDSSETYIGGMAHEAFHAYQGTDRPDHLAAAERAASVEGVYPWDDETLGEMWRAELNLLHSAVEASSDAEAAELVKQFVAQRQRRRAQPAMEDALVAYERRREWLEGLAKYAELSIQLEAARTPEYEPFPGIEDDPEFKDYRTRERFWSRQISEVKRLGGRGGETRFYYAGAVQGVLLDRLMPDWKTRIWEEGVWLEDLLAEAAGME